MGVSLVLYGHDEMHKTSVFLSLLSIFFSKNVCRHKSVETCWWPWQIKYEECIHFVLWWLEHMMLTQTSSLAEAHSRPYTGEAPLALENEPPLSYWWQIYTSGICWCQDKLVMYKCVTDNWYRHCCAHTTARVSAVLCSQRWLPTMTSSPRTPKSWSSDVATSFMCWTRTTQTGGWVK